MRLLLERDNLTVAGQDREHFAERDLNGGPTAVKQDKRNAVFATVHFVVHVDAVDRGVAAFKRFRFESRHVISSPMTLGG
jgi:hypothetical protein